MLIAQQCSNSAVSNVFCASKPLKYQLIEETLLNLVPTKCLTVTAQTAVSDSVLSSLASEEWPFPDRPLWPAPVLSAAVLSFN